MKKKNDKGDGSNWTHGGSHSRPHSASEPSYFEVHFPSPVLAVLGGPIFNNKIICKEIFDDSKMAIQQDIRSARVLGWQIQPWSEALMTSPALQSVDLSNIISGTQAPPWATVLYRYVRSNHYYFHQNFTDPGVQSRTQAPSLGLYLVYSS